jgi:hypothetical protein
MFSTTPRFSTIDSSSAVDTALFEWGVVKGDARNAGRYVARRGRDADGIRVELKGWATWEGSSATPKLCGIESVGLS